MSRLLNQVLGAIRRVDNRERPEPDDVRIIRPMLADLESKLVKDDPVMFAQAGHDFLVDMTAFPRLLGCGYTQALLRKPNTSISCSTLNPVPMPIRREEVIDADMMKSLICKKKQLKLKLNDVDRLKAFGPAYCEKIATELQQIEDFLSKNTFGGKSISFIDDLERNRQAVCKAIRLVITKIEGHPDTSHLGEYLRQNMKFGFSCAYTGDLKWKFSQKSQNDPKSHTLRGRKTASRFAWPRKDRH